MSYMKIYTIQDIAVFKTEKNLNLTLNILLEVGALETLVYTCFKFTTAGFIGITVYITNLTI